MFIAFRPRAFYLFITIYLTIMQNYLKKLQAVRTNSTKRLNMYYSYITI